MTGNELRAEVKEDFRQIWIHYAVDGTCRMAEPMKAKALLKTVHEFAVVASIVNKAIPRRRAEHKRIFLTELASDAIHLMHTLLMGDVRGGRFYFRSVVENCWRHVYYKDHAVEYRWLNSGSERYISIETLRSYFAHTDEIDSRLRKSVDRIATGYQKLSKFVHSSTAMSLQLQRRLTRIRLETSSLEDVVGDLRLFGRDLVLLLLVLHASELERLHPFERNFAVDFLDSPRKRLRLTVLA